MENQRLNFSSTTVSIPATHRWPDHFSDPTSSTVTPSVAAVHKDAEAHAVKLRKRINFGPRHGAVNTAFTDVKPSHDADADRAYSLKMRCLAMIVRLNSNEPLSLAP